MVLKFIPMRDLVFLAVLVVSLIVVWLIRYDMVRYKYQAGDWIRITGTVSQDVQITGNQQKLTVANIRIYAGRYPEYLYGDRIIAEGEVAKGLGGYYLKNSKVTKSGELSKLSAIFNLREKVLEIFQKNLGEPHSALLSGIVLGTKSSLDFDFFEKLRNTGTLHIVVASGTNIALFSGVLINITAFLWGRKRAVFICFILVWLYVAFIGFQPPIIRAAIMGTVLIFAQYLGKEAESMRALLFSAIVMLLLYPIWLFDLGFQLSFLATAGLILLGKPLNLLTDKTIIIKSLPKILKESLSTTLSAQIAVTPLLFYSFGSFSVISPVVNMLVLPVVPVIMAGGFAIGILGMVGGVGEHTASILSLLVWLPLEWFVRVVNIFG